MLAQLIFQSGEFYNQNGNSNFWTIVGLFVTLSGIIAAAVVSILVIKIQQESDRRKEEQRLLDQERLIMDGLRALSKPIQDQIKTLVTLANKLKKPEDLDHSPDVFITLDSKALRETSYSDLYQIFVLRKKGTSEQKADLFTKFNSLTEYLKIFPSDYRLSFEYFQAKYERFEREWNEPVLQISRLRDQMLLNLAQPNLAPEARTFFITIDNVFRQYVQQGNNLERYLVMRTLLSPLQVVCRTNAHPIGTQFLWLAADALQARGNIVAITQFNR